MGSHSSKRTLSTGLTALRREWTSYCLSTRFEKNLETTSQSSWREQLLVVLLFVVIILASLPNTSKLQWLIVVMFLALFLKKLLLFLIWSWQNNQRRRLR